MMKVSMGRSVAPTGHGIPREEEPTWKGCSHCALKSPAFWKILLGEAMDPVLQQREELGVRAYAPDSHPTAAVDNPRNVTTMPGGSPTLFFPMTSS